jgi:hypothetical protein
MKCHSVEGRKKEKRYIWLNELESLGCHIQNKIL